MVALASDPRGFIGGFNFNPMDDYTAVIEDCSFWVWSGVPGSGDYSGMIDGFEGQIIMDFRTVGLNGVDVNPNGAGNMAPNWCYDLYYICRTDTGQRGFIASKQGAIENVILPPGWVLGVNTAYRKTMYGVLVYALKLQPHHSSFMPMPRISMTNDIVINPELHGTVTQDFDLTALIPESSGFVNGRFVVTNGNATIFAGVSGLQKMVAFNQTSVVSFSLRCGVSTKHLLVSVQASNPSVEVDFHFDGWDQTEVS